MILVGLKGNKITVRTNLKVATRLRGIVGFVKKDESLFLFNKNLKTYIDIKVEFREEGLSLEDSIKTWLKKEAELRKMIDEIKETKYPCSTPVASLYDERPMDYQWMAVNFLLHQKRCILADDMGVGKTLEALAAIAQIGVDKRILIVCPNNLKLTWRNQIKYWLQTECTILKNESKKKRDKILSEYKSGFLIINYEKLWQRGVDGVRLIDNLPTDWDVVVADEAHRLKNRKARHVMAFKKLSTEFLWLLSGTPFENHIESFWSLANILFPKVYTSFHRFVDQYINRIWVKPKGKDKEIPIVTGAKDLDKFIWIFKPYIMRRLKSQVLKLEKPTRSKLYVEMSKTDKKIYTDLSQKMIALLPDGEIVIVQNTLAKAAKLNQVAISSQLLTDDIEEVKSSKIDTLIEYIQDNVENHKIVVFTNYRKSATAIHNRLEKSKIKNVMCTGMQSIEERDQAESQIQSTDPSSARVFIGTVKVAGEGYTLTNADICIFLDRHPNALANRQAEDRLIRKGQKNKVTIVDIVALETHEEKFLERLVHILDNFDKVFKSDEMVSKAFLEEIRNLSV